MLRLFGMKEAGHRHIHSPEEIELLIADHRLRQHIVAVVVEFQLPRQLGYLRQPPSDRCTACVTRSAVRLPMVPVSSRACETTSNGQRRTV